nr:putative ribonuclease H-like domain-containing protein [Tanacetum cinerariifolium]
LSPTKPAQDLSHKNRPTAPIIEDWVSDSEDESETKAPQTVLSFVQLVSAAVPKFRVTQPRHAKPSVTKSKSPIRRHLTRSHSPKTSNSPLIVTAVKAPVGNPQHALKHKGVIDSGCSRHMTWNMSYLFDFEELNGGYVSFGGNPKGGKISGKGKIKTEQFLFTDTKCLVLSPDFKLSDESQVLLRVPRENNMYNVNLKNIVPYRDLTCLFAKATIDESNLWHRRSDNGTEFKNNDLNLFCEIKGIKREFSVLRTPQQNGIAERKNRTLIEAARTMLADSLLPISFWAEAVNTAYYVQNRLPDEKQVLLRVPKENNMYNVNLKNIVPSGDLTCLFTKATIDESNLLHRRLGHINFKTINKLVKGNLVKGLPTKVFENDNTCVVCKKGKQHRASCKTKPVSSVDQPLYRLHIDLFGPTFVKSLNKKSYCLVVTDDYSSECLVLSSNFKLPDVSQVLLRVPRENNMYNVNLRNIVPSEDLTCLFSKATLDESNLWHRRLGHVNFKTINKLVKGNLVRGLPTKVLTNDNSCVACKKGKQHRASCKSKTVTSVDQPLFRLHIDLFGPTFVASLSKKSYCLVITDDYSRFFWVFFLASKDETTPVLKTFIIGLENLLSLKVKSNRFKHDLPFKPRWKNDPGKLFATPDLLIRDCSCSKGNVEDKILVPKPPKNYARCGHPVDGPYCQGCALLRKELEEDLVTHLKDFQNTFESSDNSTNVVNIPSRAIRCQTGPRKFHALEDGDACQRCTCKRCGSGLSKGLCLIGGNNQNSPNDPLNIYPNSSHNPLHINERCFKCGNALDGIFCQQCACKSCGKGDHIGYNCPPKVPIISNPKPCNQTMNNEPAQTLPSFDPMCYLEKENSSPCVSKPNSVENPPPQPPIYSCEFCGSNARYGHCCTPQELAEYINTLGWNRHAFYNNGDDDDVDYTIAITPVLSTEEPGNSLNSLYENIEYVEASPHDSELVSLEVEKIVIPKDEEIEDDNLREKLLKDHLDAKERKQDKCPLEIPSDFEEDVFDDEHKSRSTHTPNKKTHAQTKTVPFNPEVEVRLGMFRKERKEVEMMGN